MGTGGTIASILGAMLLGGMGKGMFQGGGEEEDSTKKLPSDPQILKMKQKNVETPEPLDVQAMMAKHAPGVSPTNANINRTMDSLPKGSFDPRAARDGGDDYRYDTGTLSNEALMGEKPVTPVAQEKIPGPDVEPPNRMMAPNYMNEMARVKSNVQTEGVMEKLIKDVIMPDMSRMPKRSKEKPTSFGEKSRKMSEEWYGK